MPLPWNADTLGICLLVQIRELTSTSDGLQVRVVVPTTLPDDMICPSTRRVISQTTFFGGLVPFCADELLNEGNEGAILNESAQRRWTDIPKKSLSLLEIHAVRSFVRYQALQKSLQHTLVTKTRSPRMRRSTRHLWPSSTKMMDRGSAVRPATFCLRRCATTFRSSRSTRIISMQSQL